MKNFKIIIGFIIALIALSSQVFSQIDTLDSKLICSCVYSIEDVLLSSENTFKAKPTALKPHTIVTMWNNVAMNYHRYYLPQIQIKESPETRADLEEYFEKASWVIHLFRGAYSGTDRAGALLDIKKLTVTEKPFKCK